MFHCNYDLKSLNESLPTYYCHVLLSWKEYREQICGNIEPSRQIIWNNTSIRINNLPVYYKKLASLGCLFVADLYHKGVLRSFDYWVRKGAFSVSEYLKWMSLIDSIPEKWRLATRAISDVTDYHIKVDYIQLLVAKKVYQVFLRKVAISPTAKKWIQDEFNVCDDLLENIYTIPFLSTVHTKVKELQLSRLKIS